MSILYKTQEVKRPPATSSSASAQCAQITVAPPSGNAVQRPETGAHEAGNRFPFMHDVHCSRQTCARHFEPYELSCCAPTARRWTLKALSIVPFAFHLCILTLSWHVASYVQDREGGESLPSEEQR